MGKYKLKITFVIILIFLGNNICELEPSTCPWILH